jgi:hypothetical protein
MLLPYATIQPGKRAAGQLASPYPTSKARLALTSSVASVSAPFSSSSRTSSGCPLEDALYRAVSPRYSHTQQYRTPRKNKSSRSATIATPNMHITDIPHLIFSLGASPLFQQQPHNLCVSPLSCQKHSRPPFLLPDATIPYTQKKEKQVSYHHRDPHAQHGQHSPDPQPRRSPPSPAVAALPPHVPS